MNDGGDCRTAPATPGLLNIGQLCTSAFHFWWQPYRAPRKEAAGTTRTPSLYLAKHVTLEAAVTTGQLFSIVDHFANFLQWSVTEPYTQSIFHTEIISQQNFLVFKKLVTFVANHEYLPLYLVFFYLIGINVFKLTGITFFFWTFLDRIFFFLLDPHASTHTHFFSYSHSYCHCTCGLFCVFSYIFCLNRYFQKHELHSLPQDGKTHSQDQPYKSLYCGSYMLGNCGSSVITTVQIEEQVSSLLKSAIQRTVWTIWYFMARWEKSKNGKKTWDVSHFLPSLAPSNRPCGLFFIC